MTEIEVAEICSICEHLTGRAGRADDSLYLETPRGEVGPLCEGCHDALRPCPCPGCIKLRAVIARAEPAESDSSNDASPDLLTALKNIAQGKGAFGAFDRDPLTHAKNVIQNMIGIADTAIAKAEPAQSNDGEAA